MPSLLTVDGKRIELEPNHRYVLGRGPESDIIVGDMSASRRHARLTVGGEARRALFIEDLGSRNGTFVNDERIFDRTAVQDGCLVRIGATVYMLSLKEDGKDEGFVDTGTVAIEKFSFGMDIDANMAKVLRRDGPGSTNFAGRLESIGLVEVLQLLILNQRSGSLHVQLRGGIGTIELRDGEVRSAAFQEMRGFKALVMLAREAAGNFWLAESNADCDSSIDEQSSQLLVELCRALDEG
jgi:hypothetical protein